MAPFHFECIILLYTPPTNMSLNPLGGIVNVNLDLIIGLTHAHAVETDIKKKEHE